MKKLNYSWKVAGFALLFGLSMGLQSCDEIIDNPLSPTQPTPETPAAPVNPKATVKGSTVTIENCKTTKDVNDLLNSADVKKVFAETTTLDKDGNTQTIEIIVKGGIETADAIVLPSTAFDPRVQITFNDAFTKAEKDLVIKNNNDNTNRFTVKLPESDSGINLDLTVADNCYDNYVTGKAVLNTVKASVVTPDTTCIWCTYADLTFSENILIKAYDFDKQKNVRYYVTGSNPIEAVVLGNNANTTCYKKGFMAENVEWDWETCYVPNAIIPAGTTVWVWPASELSSAKKIFIEKGAELGLNERQDNEVETDFYTASVESIVGADRTAKFLNDQTASYGELRYWWASPKWCTIKQEVGSISNVTIPNWWGDDLPTNVSSVTFGAIDNGASITIPSDVKSVSGIDFNCNVNIELTVAETGMNQFTFENCNFGASSNNIRFVPESDIILKDASGNPILITVYVWKDKDGVIHTDTKDPSGDAKFASWVNTYTRYATDDVKYEDFKAFMSFVGCKIDGKTLDSTLLSPMVWQQSFGTGSQVIYQIGYNSNYRLSDSGVLVAI